MKKINPFKPNSPVPAALFAGRLNEIELFEQSLHQTKNDNPRHFLVTGERGIGKSSLLTVFEPTANGRWDFHDFDQFNFITINISISDRSNLLSFIKLIERGLKRELRKIETMREFLDTTWSFVQRIQIMDSGIGKNAETEEPDLVIDDFTYSLSETCKRIANSEKNEAAKDGIVIFIDEADNATPDLHLGYFLKIVSEKLQQYGCNNVMFVVAGLPETVEKLIESHESSLRIFTQLKIKVLNTDERHYLINRAMEVSNENNEEQTSITDSAKDAISTLSEGYPHFIQQFGYSAFEHSSTNEISHEDVVESTTMKGGAIDLIGSKYYSSQYHAQIKSDEYREVLRIMADKMNLWIQKKEIQEQFSGSSKTLSNALTSLTAKKIILKNPSKRGEYRLQQRGFAIWIKLFGTIKK